MFLRIGRMGMVLSAGVLALAPLRVSADDAFDAYVESEFTVGMATMMAERCDGIALDQNARRIYRLHEDQVLIGLGKNPSTYGSRLAASQFDQANAAFAARHGFTGQTTLEDFCAAAARERSEETEIGKMLKDAE